MRVVDGFDLYLGGGISGAIQLGVLYKKGVPFSQLPELLERTIKEFRLHRQERESFSAFWRKRLDGARPEVVASEEPPIWRCQECEYLQSGPEPPGFCPRCAAVRSRFIVDDTVEAVHATAEP